MAEEQTHIYVARAWYRDTAVWFNIVSVVAGAAEAFDVVNLVPAKQQPFVLSMVGFLNLVIRKYSSTRPVALTEGLPVRVQSIKPKRQDRGTVSKSHDSQQKYIPLVLLALLLSQGCASMGGPRHVAVVSVVSAHAVLSAVQDTEKSLVCGVAGAPEPPACIPQATHLAISRDLVTAFDYDGQVARLVRAVPPGGIMPADIPGLLGKIAGLVDRIIASLPTSAKKAQLVQQIAGVQQ